MSHRKNARQRDTLLIAKRRELLPSSEVMWSVNQPIHNREDKNEHLRHWRWR